MNDAARAIESAVGESYGRLVAILASRTRDVAGAEDALSEALAIALERWPRDGVPASPCAWLVTTARRRLIDAGRHDAVRERAHAEIFALADEAIEAPAVRWPDERLKLLFACTHPAIDESVRTPLMLQVVLGLSVERIAGVFVCSPSTLGQRLARAKRKLKDAGVAFDLPAPDVHGERLAQVLDGIYAAYGTAWIEARVAGASLGAEARVLADAVVELLPDEPEALALAALMRYCDARSGARHDERGRYVPLSEQDPSRWDARLCDEGDMLLTRAARSARHGPFQFEAAIQSAHASRRHGFAVPPPVLLALYDRLIDLRPRLGALVARACVLADVAGPETGLDALAEVADEARDYAPWWAARADLAARCARDGGRGRRLRSRDRAGRGSVVARLPARSAPPTAGARKRGQAPEARRPPGCAARRRPGARSISRGAAATRPAPPGRAGRASRCARASACAARSRTRSKKRGKSPPSAASRARNAGRRSS